MHTSVPLLSTRAGVFVLSYLPLPPLPLSPLPLSPLPPLPPLPLLPLPPLLFLLFLYLLFLVLASHLQENTVRDIADILSEGGQVFLQSDVEEIAVDMRDQFEQLVGDVMTLDVTAHEKPSTDIIHGDDGYVRCKSSPYRYF